MFNARLTEDDASGGGERKIGRSSTASSTRPTALPPIVVLSTSGGPNRAQGTTSGAPSLRTEASAPQQAGALVPFADSPPRSVDASPPSQRQTRLSAVNEEDDEGQEVVETEEKGCDDGALVPCYLPPTAAALSVQLAESEVALSPTSRALAVLHHAHVCPTCGRPLDESDFGIEDDTDLDNDEASMHYAVVGGGSSHSGSWTARRNPSLRDRRVQPRVASTYPGHGPAPAAISARGAVGDHTAERSFTASAASGNSQAVVACTTPRSFMRGLTPQYFRALALTAPPSVLAIGESGTPPTTTVSSPLTISTDGAGSDDLDDITAYVSPTGRHPPRGIGYPVIEAVGGTGLIVTSPRPPQSSKPVEPRPAAPASAEEFPTPPLASAPAPVESYYGRYFVEMAKLGSGAFGGVYLCQHVVEGVPLGLFALKKIPVGDATPYLQSVLREVRILEEVKRHPNVVEYSHSWVEEAQLADFGPPVRCLFILMEYATEGSLDAYMDRSGAPLSTVAVWYFFLSAVAGTAHLHTKGILHRDLKPQNLLLTSSGDGRPPRVLVSDFGTAALLDDTGYDRTGGTGTLEYMAPELLERDARVATETYVNRHTKASDIWSLGMILYYLAFDGTLPPVREDGTPDLRDLLDRGRVQRPQEMVELVRAMLQRDPARRPSCYDIMRSTVVQTIIRAFNHPSRTEADIFEPMAAFRTAGAQERSYATALSPEEGPLDEEATNHSAQVVGRVSSPGVRSVHRRATQLMMRDDTARGEGASDPPSAGSSPRSGGRNGGSSSRVELLSMTSTMPMGYADWREPASPLAQTRHRSDRQDGGAGADIPPLFARYHSNDVRRNSIVPTTAPSAGGGRAGSPVSAQSGTAQMQPATPPSHSDERGESGKRARQAPFGQSFANSPPPERRRRLSTADASVQTDPVTILDPPSSA